MAESGWLAAHLGVAALLLAYAGAWALAAWRWSAELDPEAVDAKLLERCRRRRLGLDQRLLGWLLLGSAIGSGLMVADGDEPSSAYLAAKLAVVIGLAIGLPFFLRRPQPAMAYFLLVFALAIAALSLPLLT